MSNLSVFNFNTHSIRVNSNDPFNPLFVAYDAASALGYKKPRNAIARHCKNQTTAPKQGGGILTLIPESDLYRLIFSSKLKTAEKFADWVFEEVLPSIRKTGKYEVPQDEPVLSDDQAGHIYQTVMSLVADGKGTYQGLFSSLKKKFNRSSYKLIKASDYAKACQFLGVKPLSEYDDGLTAVPHIQLVNLIRQVRTLQTCLVLAQRADKNTDQLIEEIKRASGYHFADDGNLLN